jgi:hypothetical protein
MKGVLLVLLFTPLLSAAYKILHLTGVLFFLSFFFFFLFVSLTCFFSDLHFDPFYQEGTSSDCVHKHEVFCCCRNNSVPEHPNQTYPARRFGEYHCDSPKALIDSMLGTKTLI